MLSNNKNVKIIVKILKYLSLNPHNHFWLLTQCVFQDQKQDYSVHLNISIVKYKYLNKLNSFRRYLSEFSTFNKVFSAEYPAYPNGILHILKLWMFSDKKNTVKSKNTQRFIILSNSSGLG